jgi:hypothetical protein
MPRDRLDPLSLGSVSVIGQSETVSARRGFVLHPEESDFYGPAEAISGRTIIAACTSPASNVPFRYFCSGQIFMVEANDVGPRSENRSPKRRIEFFWLCGECAPAMHLMRTADGGVTICQLPRPADPPVAVIASAREVMPWLSAPKLQWIST